MNSKCKRCGGELQWLTERNYTTVYFGGVLATTCDYCHNEIGRLMQTHSRWKEVMELDIQRVIAHDCSQELAEQRTRGVVAKSNELTLFFHDYVRSLLPFQVKAAADKVEV